MDTMQEIFRRWRRYTGDVKATLGGHVLNLKILESPREHQSGFMGKPEPDTTFGLYFLYPTSAVRGFWMKNVPFDLDLLGFDDKMRLFEVIHLKAGDETERRLSKPCRHVLELRRGFCASHGITPGMVLEIDGD